jgi:hypothetical protein
VAPLLPLAWAALVCTVESCRVIPVGEVGA